MANDDARKEKIATLAKWGFGLVGAVVISPIIFLAVKGIVGLGLALITGFVLVQFTPVVAQKIANWKVKAILHEDEKNPIEGELNAARQRESLLEEKKKSITAFRSEVTTFEGQVKTFKVQSPEDAPRFEEQLAQMKRLLLYRVEKWKDAKRKHEDSLIKIQKMKAFWDMSKKAQRMSKIAGQDTDDTIFEKIRSDVRMDSVNASVSLAFSELESSLMDDEAKQIPVDYKPSIEYKPAEIEEFVNDTVEADVVPIQRRRAAK